MPVVDMPLTKLQNYGGTNPRPEDFDIFWDKMLENLDKHDPEILLSKTNFNVPNAECFDLWFTGIDKSRIYAKYVRPTVSGAKTPAILNFHGYTGNSGEWWDKLAWVNAGFSITSMDCRGQAGLSEDNREHTMQTGNFIRGIDGAPEDMLFVKNFLDTALLARIVGGFEETDQSKICTMGGSQGGALALVCAALVPNIHKVAAAYPFLCDYKRVWQMEIQLSAYKELYDYFRQHDPEHRRENEIFEKLGYIDIQNFAKRIKATVLCACGLVDLACPPSTQFAVYNKIDAPKSMRIYPDFGHENLLGFMDNIMQFFLE